MSLYDISPTDDLRKWLWEEIQEAGIVQASDYAVPGMGNLNPIIPVQQQPEFVDKVAGKPFITYDIVGKPVPAGLWYITCEQVLFTVWCEDFKTARALRNLMYDLFRRQDDSARDLNETTTSDFGYLNVTVVENRWINAERSQTGRLAFDMIIEVKYVRNLDAHGRFS
jgi:hypothetical protein